MKGQYSIAVYGKASSNYIISASQNKYPVVTVYNNVKTKGVQGSYETKLFRFDGDQDERKDIIMKMFVRSGKCDMYVNTYDPINDS